MANTANENRVVNRYKAYRATGDAGMLGGPEFAANQTYVDPTYKGPSGFEMGASALAGGLGTLATTANPYLAAGAAGLGLWQQFQNQDATKDAYKAQLAQYNEQLALDSENKAEQKKQQAIANMYSDANNSKEVQDSILSKYSAYNRQTGR